jgi:hypothetical protein
MLITPHEHACIEIRCLATTPMLSAILVGPPRGWFKDLGAPLRRIPLLQEVRRSLKTQQHAHSSAEPRPRDVSRFDAVARPLLFGEQLERRCQN